MNENLKRKIAEVCAKNLKRILLIQHELTQDRKNNGIKTYTLEEYNNYMNILFKEKSIMYKKTNIISKLEKELADNLFLSFEEIDEIVTRFKENIIKYGVEKNKRYPLPITHLLSKVINEEINEKNLNGELSSLDKWEYAIDSIKPLGINDKLMIKYEYNQNFILTDSSRDYICYINDIGIDKIDDVSSLRRSKEKFYLSKNLFIIENEDNITRFVYKENDIYHSIFLKEKYYDKNAFNNIFSLNQIFKKFGIEIDEVYNTFTDIANIISIIKNYLEIKDEIDNIVIKAVDYWEELIFTPSNDFIYHEYQKLLPTYSEEQKNNFKQKLSQIIKKELLINGDTKLHISPQYDNKLLNLLNDLFIEPSPLVLGKVMTINLESKEIIVTDKLNNKEDLIYSKDTKIKKK